MDNETNIFSLKELYFQLGRTYLSLDYSASAIENYQIALQQTGTSINDWEIHAALATAYMSIKNFSEAQQHYLTGYLLNPAQNPGAIRQAQELLNETWCKENKELSAKLILQTQAALSRQDMDKSAIVELKIFLGRIAMFNGEMTMAASYFAEAHALDPGHVFAIENMGELSRREGKFSDALKYFEQAYGLAISNDDTVRQAYIRFRKARLYFDLGEYTNALQESDGLDISQSYLKIIKSKIRSESFLQLGQPGDARMSAREILELEPGNRDAILLQVRADILLGEYEEAGTSLDKAYTDGWANNETDLLKAQVQIEGQLAISEGIKLLEKLKDLQPSLLTEKLSSADFGTRPQNGNTLFFNYFLRKISGISNREDQLAELNNCLNQVFVTKSYPERFVIKERALLYEQSGNTQLAATDYLDAAKRYYWAADYAGADILFERSIANDNMNAPAYWYRSDCLYLLSLRDGTPPNDEKILQQAYDMGYQGMSIRLPLENEAWVYLTLARIHQGRFNFTVQQPEDEYRMALHLMEQSVFINDQDDFALGHLAQYYSFCGLNLNALAVIEMAEQLNSDEPLIKETKAAVLLELGYLDESDKVASEAYATIPNLFYDSWKANICLRKGENDKGLELLNNKLATTETDTWTMMIKAQLHWMKGEFSKAEECAQWIMDKYRDPENVNDQDLKMNAGYAAFILRDYKNADLIYEEYEANGDFDYYVFSNKVLTCLCQDRLPQATAYFNKCGQCFLLPHTLSFFKKELENVLVVGEKNQWPHREQLKKIIATGDDAFVKQIMVLMEKLEADLPDAIDEANYFLRKDKHFMQGTGWKALMAGLARLQLRHENTIAALSMYKELVAVCDTYNKPAVIIRKLNDKNNSLTGIRGFWQLKYYLRQQSVALQHTDPLLGTFFNELDKQVDISTVPNDRGSYVLPVGLELPGDLVPQKQDESKEANEYMPQYTLHIREEIEKDFIARIPTFRFRRNDAGLEPGTYLLYLNEVPRVVGITYPGHVFCYQTTKDTLLKAGIPEADMITVRMNDYFSENRDGFWIPTGFTGNLKNNQVDYWEDPALFILQHVKNYIIQNITDFITLDMVDERLKEEGSKESAAGIQDKTDEYFATNEAERKIRFLKIIKALLGERIPVRNVKDILFSMQPEDLDNEEILFAVIRLRQYLHNDLPGINAGLVKAELPPDMESSIEKFIYRPDNRLTIQIPPAETQDLLDGFRDWVANTHPDAVIVQDPLNRFFAKKVFELEFPDIDFITADEANNKDVKIEKVKQPVVTEAIFQACAHCGKPLSPDDRFCSNCGTPYAARVQETIAHFPATEAGTKLFNPQSEIQIKPIKGTKRTTKKWNNYNQDSNRSEKLSFGKTSTGATNGTTAAATPVICLKLDTFFSGRIDADKLNKNFHQIRTTDFCCLWSATELGFDIALQFEPGIQKPVFTIQSGGEELFYPDQLMAEVYCFVYNDFFRPEHTISFLASSLQQDSNKWDQFFSLLLQYVILHNRKKITYTFYQSPEKISNYFAYDNTQVRTVIGALVEHGIATQRLADFIDHEGKSWNEMEQNLQRLIEHLNPRKFSISFNNNYFEQIASNTASLDDNLMNLLNENMFYELGINYSPAAIRVQDDIPDHFAQISINDLPGIPSKGLLKDQFLVNTDKYPDENTHTENKIINPANGLICLVIAGNELTLFGDQYTWTDIGYIVLLVSAALRKLSYCLVDNLQTKSMLDDAEIVAPAVVKYILDKYRVDQLTEVLQMLTKEEINIKNSQSIFQHILEYDHIEADSHENIVFDQRLAIKELPTDALQIPGRYLVQYIRNNMRPYISQKYSKGSGSLSAILPDPAVEKLLLDQQYDKETRQTIMEAVRLHYKDLPPCQPRTPILTSDIVRPVLTEIIQEEFLNLPVLAYQELLQNLNIQVAARISLE